MNTRDLSQLGLSLSVRMKIVRAVECTNSVHQEVAEDYICPITQTMYIDPVVAADGHTYEKSAIQKWFDSGKKR